MIVLLDTDHVSILQHKDEAATTLRRRLAELPADAVRTCIVSFEEQARGYLAYLRRARKRQEILRAFANLQQLLKDYQAHQVLSFDDAAMDEFLRLQQQHLRIGTHDLRIAA